MLQQTTNGSIDWMSLAAKMFMAKLDSQTATQKQRGGVKSFVSPPPPPATGRARSPLFRHRARAADPPAPTHLSADCVATIRQFEALRVQLLRHLVLYQTQLLALKMPPLPCELVQQEQKNAAKIKVIQNRPKVKKCTSTKNIKSGPSNEMRKWEKLQLPTHTLKNQNKRRSQVFQKQKKSSKKATKRKLEDVQTTVSDNYLDTNVDKMKRTCQAYQSCMRNYTSSSDSFYSSMHAKGNNYGLSALTMKDSGHQDHSSFTTCQSDKNTSILRPPIRKSSKLNKKISSAFVFDTATDEFQS